MWIVRFIKTKLRWWTSCRVDQCSSVGFAVVRTSQPSQVYFSAWRVFDRPRQAMGTIKQLDEPKPSDGIMLPDDFSQLPRAEPYKNSWFPLRHARLILSTKYAIPEGFFLALLSHPLKTIIRVTKDIRKCGEGGGGGWPTVLINWRC